MLKTLVQNYGTTLVLAEYDDATGKGNYHLRSRITDKTGMGVPVKAAEQHHVYVQRSGTNVDGIIGCPQWWHFVT